MCVCGCVVCFFRLCLLCRREGKVRYLLEDLCRRSSLTEVMSFDWVVVLIRKNLEFGRRIRWKENVSSSHDLLAAAAAATATATARQMTHREDRAIFSKIRGEESVSLMNEPPPLKASCVWR